jgi:hypothetical protein
MRVLLGLLLLLLVSLVWLWPRYPYLPAEPSPWQAKRLSEEPIVSAVGEEHGYININGPTVIRVPDWVENPLGDYYMYFAHHKGSYIRLAHADDPAGPWIVHEPGVMPLAGSGFPVSPDQVGLGSGGLRELWATFSLPVVRDYLRLAYRATVVDPAERRARGISAAANKAVHVASPEVVIDQQHQRLVLFYHGLNSKGGQSSRIATSTDGLDFTPLEETVFSTYLRTFEYGDKYYLLGMPGVVYRGDSLTGPFEPRDSILFEPDMRHAGLLVEDSTLHVFWSRVGDAPEHIMLSQVDLSSSDWNQWQATAPVEILRPRLSWEGADIKVAPSLRGEMDITAHELRDPYVFRDEDGALYLYYVGGGEKAIGVAMLSAQAGLVP